MKNPNGELESTLVGIILIVGSAVFLYRGDIPWMPWGGATFIGVYLMLPERMRQITNAITGFLKRKGSNGV